MEENIFPNSLLVTWCLITGLIILLRVLSFCFDFIHLQWISFSIFIFPGVTGLSFSVTMLNATRNLFTIDELVAMFKYTDPEDKDINEEGDVLYRTLAPYIIASILWLVISMISFASSLITVEINVVIKEILYAIFNGIVVAGFLNLWYLISVHIEDISVKVEIELNKKKE